MVEGELLQLSSLGRMDLGEQDVLDLAARKTACLFSGCARLGGVLGSLTDSEEQSLADYGHFAGLAFQLVDDLLDFTASPLQLGKPVLSDLKEGKVTLPLIYALQSDGAAGVGMVRTVLEEKGFHSVRPEQISALVRDSGALDRTRVLANEYASRAKACLNGRAADRIWPRALRRSRFHPRPRTLVPPGIMLPFKLVYHEGYDLRLGQHVFQSQKFGMVRDALLAGKIADRGDFLSPEPATDEDILRVHTPRVGR